MDRRRFLCLSFLTCSILLSACQARYVLRQGWHQLTLGCDQVPLDSPSLEKTLTVAEREKLSWIPRVVEYCREELGLTPGDAYSTFLDTGGKPISYVVTAAHPLALVPYRWRPQLDLILLSSTCRDRPMLLVRPVVGTTGLASLLSLRGSLGLTKLDSFVKKSGPIESRVLPEETEPGSRGSLEGSRLGAHGGPTERSSRRCRSPEPCSPRSGWVAAD